MLNICNMTLFVYNHILRILALLNSKEWGICNMISLTLHCFKKMHFQEQQSTLYFHYQCVRFVLDETINVELRLCGLYGTIETCPKIQESWQLGKIKYFWDTCNRNLNTSTNKTFKAAGEKLSHQYLFVNRRSRVRAVVTRPRTGLVGQNTSCKAHKVCILLRPTGWDDVRTRADESPF